ncbi:MAG: hypothetical protein AAF665_02560 [Pseudomonadota bacterium]
MKNNESVTRIGALAIAVGLSLGITPAAQAATFNAMYDFVMTIDASSTDDLEFNFSSGLSSRDVTDGPSTATERPFADAANNVSPGGELSSADGDVLPSEISLSNAIQGDSGPFAGSSAQAESQAGFTLEITYTGDAFVNIGFDFTDFFSNSISALDAPASIASLDTDFQFRATNGEDIDRNVGLNISTFLDQLFDTPNEFGGQGPILDDPGFGGDALDVTLSADVRTINISLMTDFSGFARRNSSTVTPVPVPAAGWMLFAGVAAIGALRRRAARRVT